MRGPVSARRVFQAAARGDDRAKAVVAEEAQLVAKTICAVITVVDPDLIVLGGGIGRAPGFAEAVAAELEQIALRHAGRSGSGAWETRPWSTAAWPPGPSWPGRS